MLAETINGFNELTIKSTINNSKEDDAGNYPSRDPKVATYTTNRSSPHKVILNQLIPKIIPGAIRPIYQMIMEDVAEIGDTLDTCQTVLSKNTVTDAARSGARISGLLGR